ncbi:ribonuclease H-like domain-containing protein [Tanacetum coccineum]|uniref:Ribonuclease H-like domain-containing protein n=1 Tax=Tanacetum coccineum TaxID=301880 RepID=A0ABQ5E2G6_9ASTR
MSNLTTSYYVSTTPNTRIHKDHSLDHVIGDIQSGVQTRGMTKNTNEHGFISIDYDEVFAHVARIEAIRFFLAYASFMGFMVYQMDVKSAFLYGTIEEEVYVDDIIFGSTNKELCTKFEKLMHDKFQMSSMGELNFFLDCEDVAPPMRILKMPLSGSDVCACADSIVTPKVFTLTCYEKWIFSARSKLLVATSSTEAKYVAAASCCGQDHNFADFFQKALDVGRISTARHIEYLVCDVSNTYTPRQIKRGRDTKIPQSSGPPKKVGDEAVHKELGDIMERVVTTASSYFKAEEISNQGLRRIITPTVAPLYLTTTFHSQILRDSLSDRKLRFSAGSPLRPYVADEAAIHNVWIEDFVGCTTVYGLEEDRAVLHTEDPYRAPMINLCLRVHTLGSDELLRGYSFDEIKLVFKVTVKRVNTFTPTESDDTVPKVVAGSSKRSEEEELERGHDIFMLVEKDYPLTRALMTLMLCNKLRVREYSKMANELLRKIFILTNRPRHLRTFGFIQRYYTLHQAKEFKICSLGSTSGIRDKIMVSDDKEDEEDSSKHESSLIED